MSTLYTKKLFSETPKSTDELRAILEKKKAKILYLNLASYLLVPIILVFINFAVYKLNFIELGVILFSCFLISHRLKPSLLAEQNISLEKNEQLKNMAVTKDIHNYLSSIYELKRLPTNEEMIKIIYAAQERISTLEIQEKSQKTNIGNV